MRREWKPGDVASILRSGTQAAFRTDVGWTYIDGSTNGLDADDYIARPLVVIDPEDREQIERLAERIGHLWRSHDYVRDVVRIALREFVNPKPKPEEPTGAYAEVEDSEGVIWFRDRNGIWRRPDFAGKDWKHITVVKVLSEGVNL